MRRLVAIALLLCSCRTLSAQNADLNTQRCLDLEDQRRIFSGLGTFGIALGGAGGTLAGAKIEDDDTRLAVAVSSAVVVAGALAFQSIAGDVDEERRAICETKTSSKTR